MTENENVPDWTKEKRNYVTGWSMWRERDWQVKENQNQIKKYYGTYEIG